MRNSCKFARDQHAKLPAFPDKNTCNLQAKTLELQVKIPTKRRQKYPHNRGQKYPKFYSKLTAIAANLLSHRG